MPVKSLQPSLAGGEMSPSLGARVDLAKYKTGVKLLKNWIIHPHGGVSNRAGMRFVAEMTTTLASRQVTRLVPFVASSLDAYVLEFGIGYIRFIYQGAYVETAPGTGIPYTVGVNITAAQIKGLKFSQSNDILTITHPDWAPMELARFGHRDWRVSVISWFPRVAAPIIANLYTNIAFNSGGGAVVGGGVYNPTSYYMPQSYFYALTAIDANGEESVNGGGAGVVNDLRWQPGNNNVLVPNPHATAVSFNVYRHDGDDYFYVGNVRAGAQFVDKNYQRKMGETWPTNRNPFGPNNYPRVSAYYQQRRIFASSYSKPQTVWGTQSTNYYNFSAARPAKDSDAIEFSIASQEIQQIKHIVGLEELLLFTSSGEWKVTGTKDEVIGPASLDLKPQSNYGCSDLPPIIIGDQVLFVQQKGNMVRDIGYKFDVNRYTGNDLSVLSQHLFEGRTIVDWAYAQVPDSIVWCVMSDGVLLSLTYMREHEVWGWARHETRGKVRSVCAVPEGDHDAVYLLVERIMNGQVRHFIERMGSTYFRKTQDAFRVDCGLSLDAPSLPFNLVAGTTTSATYVGHGLANGDEIEVEVRDTGPGTTMSLEGSYLVSGTHAGGFTLNRLDGSPVNSVGQDFTGTLAVFRRKVQSVSGLTHLNGMAVRGLADGIPIGMNDDLVVVSGRVDLPFKAARVHLGLGYVSDMESLELTQGDQNTTNRIKSVVNVALRVLRTAGLKAGPNFDRLEEHRPFIPGDHQGPPPLYTDDIRITPDAGWTSYGRVCVRQEYPLPANILGLMPEIEYGS